MTNDDLTIRSAAPVAQSDLTTRSLSIRATTIDEQARTIDGVIATENPVAVMDPLRWEVIDEVLRIDGAQLPAQMPLLDQHNRYELGGVLGSVRNMRTDADGQIIGTLYFAAAGNEGADRAWPLIAAGHITDLSAGYRSTEYVDIPAGQTATVKGKPYTAGARTLRVTTNWTPREASVVVIGADPKSKVREEPHTNGRVAPENKAMNLRQYLESLGLRHEADEAEAQAFHDGLKGEQRIRADELKSAKPAASVSVAPPASVAAPAVNADVVRAEAINAERARVRSLTELAGSDIPAEMLTRAISEGWDTGRASAEFLKHIREKTTPPVQRVEVTGNQQEGMRAAMIDSIVIRGGVKIDDAKRVANTRDFQGMGLQDIARAAIHAVGRRVPHDPDALFRESIDMQRDGAISSFSLSNLLGGSFQRILQGAYEAAPSTLMQWAQPREVRDFRTVTNIRMSGFNSMVKVGAGGEMEHDTLSETTETYKADTYGKRFSVTRRDFINDDLGAFARIPGDLGIAAKMNVDDIGYALLISASGVGPTLNEDSIALFNASHTNLPASGTQSNYVANYPLSATNLGVLKKTLRLLKHGNTQLNTTADVLLVPAALENDALTLVRSTMLIDGTATALQGSTNIHAGTVQVVVEPRLDAGTNGTTAWYLVSRRIPSIIVAFLRGNQNPIVERKDPTDVLGFGWWVYHDTGVGAIDYRGIVRSKGTS